MEKEGERVRVSESPKIEYDLCVCVYLRVRWIIVILSMHDRWLAIWMIITYHLH